MTDNELIAEFMGVDHHPLTNKYDTSWDWLMPVVEKIGKQYIPTDLAINRITIFEPIEGVYSAVVQFIKWYNQTKKP